MISAIKKHQAVVEKLCQQYQVVRLEIFGSAARDVEESSEALQTGRRDLDFLVEFAPCTPTEHAQRYLTLLEALQDIFDCEIDLLETRAIRNPYFLESINHDRVTLYAA